MVEAADSVSVPQNYYDFEDLGCGDLIMALLKAIRPLAVGTVIEVRALDLAASIDIRAWCRLSGHVFVSGPYGPENALFTIRKGEKP